MTEHIIHFHLNVTGVDLGEAPARANESVFSTEYTLLACRLKGHAKRMGSAGGKIVTLLSEVEGSGEFIECDYVV